MLQDLDTGQIKTWRSIVTLVVFVLTNLTVLFPYHIPICVPRWLANAVLDILSTWRVISPRQEKLLHGDEDDEAGKVGYFVWLKFHMNFVTAPLVADLFLLSISAIGRAEVHDGTIGANNISPVDIMLFFLTLAYIAISIDASGLIRYLAFKVAQKYGGQKSGNYGHELFGYLYAFFFGLGTCIGNDPIILSGTAFLAYLTRVSGNIMHPRAWIVSQFAVANTASAILVSSNPTNLVLAGAFKIKFITYSANMIVPVVVTAIVVFPFLLYVVFADERLIPLSIEIREFRELPAQCRGQPRNPNMPRTRGNSEEEEYSAMDAEQSRIYMIAQIMNPNLDKEGAWFGAVIMAVTLVTLLVLNAVDQSQGQHPVFWVTLPAAFIMLCHDFISDFFKRKKRRESREEPPEAEPTSAEPPLSDEHELAKEANVRQEEWVEAPTQGEPPSHSSKTGTSSEIHAINGGHDRGRDHGQKIALAANNGASSTSPFLDHLTILSPEHGISENGSSLVSASSSLHDSSTPKLVPGDEKSQRIRPVLSPIDTAGEVVKLMCGDSSSTVPPTHMSISEPQVAGRPTHPTHPRATLVSVVKDAYHWSHETFPTVVTVMTHLPFMLVPFALSMFVLVQGLVTKGWVPVFAHGWDHWVTKTGTIGSIGGMGFLSVILCNFAGTNIGSTILLSRIIQAWQDIHRVNGTYISDRTFWATVYSMALGVNYGAYSMAFSASLAGLLWRDILERKHIHVGRLEFAGSNLPIIGIAMAVGCAVLAAEVYIVRHDSPYDPR